MHGNTKILKIRPRLALSVSLGVALLLVLTVVQALIAADNTTQVAQSAPNPDLPAQMITQTDSITVEAAIEDYVAGHILTIEQLEAMATEGVEYAVAGVGIPSITGEKRVGQASAQAGTTLNYNIVISNTNLLGEAVVVTDTLPAELTYVSGSLVATGGIATNVVTGTNQIVWEGTIGSSTTATISFSALLTDTVGIGEVITNTAQLDWQGNVANLTAGTLIVTEPPTQTMYMPIIYRSVPATVIVSTRPNSANQWTVSWNSIATNATYQLQESHDPTFATGTTTTNVNGTSKAIVHTADTNNVYYYRVRGIVNGLSGEWSPAIKVIGGYADEFTSAQSGWATRRTTFIEKVRTFYEIDATKDWLIFQVEDSWDWGITSPMKPAPTPPYVIEYRAMHANSQGNLLSQGVVFGGDWVPGTRCLIVPGAGFNSNYLHGDCFNQFYNTNVIFFSGLKLLFERVDSLVWCLECLGSPMKRLGDIDQNNVKSLSNVDPDGWNNFRVEVRESDIKFFVNGNLQFTYNDTRYVTADRPYFGIFASADEYSNSTARFEYLRVLPLDN